MTGSPQRRERRGITGVQARFRIYNERFGLMALLTWLLVPTLLINSLVALLITSRILTSCFGSPTLIGLTFASDECFKEKNIFSLINLQFSELLLLMLILLLLYIIVKMELVKRELPQGGLRRRILSIDYYDVIFLIKDPHVFFSFLIISIVVLAVFNGAMLFYMPLGNLECLAQLICPNDGGVTCYLGNDPSISDNVQLYALLVDVTLAVGLPLVLNSFFSTLMPGRDEMLRWHGGRVVEETISSLRNHFLVVGQGRLGDLFIKYFLRWRFFSSESVFPTRYRIGEDAKRNLALLPFRGNVVVVDRDVLGPYPKTIGEDFTAGLEDVELTYGEKEDFIGARGDLRREIVQETLKLNEAMLVINTADNEETHRFLEERNLELDEMNLITRVYNLNWPGTGRFWGGALKVDVNRDGVYHALGRVIPYLLESTGFLNKLNSLRESLEGVRDENRGVYEGDELDGGE